MKRLVSSALVVVFAATALSCRSRNLRQAEALIDSGDYAGADRLLTQMLERNRADAEVHLLAGKLLLWTDRTEVGVSELEMAAAIDPTLKPRIARLYLDAGARWFEGRIKPPQTPESGAPPLATVVPPPPPPPPPPPAARGISPKIVRVVPKVVADVAVDDRLRGYFEKAVAADPQIARAIADWALKTGRTELDRNERAKALVLVRTAGPIDAGSRSRFVAFLVEGAKICSSQNDAAFASRYLAEALRAGAEDVAQLRDAARVLAGMKRAAPEEFDDTTVAKDQLCELLKSEAGAVRKDDELAWIAYNGVFQSPRDYLTEFPAGSHAEEARALSRSQGKGRPACAQYGLTLTDIGGIPGGVVGGVPGGVPGGVIGGVIGGVEPAQPPRAAPSIPKATPQRIRVGANVQQSRLINHVAPVYPPLAKQARVTGVVTFTAIIGTDGAIKNLQLISGHPLLVPAAQEAIRQWTYSPTLLNGEPVEVVTQIIVNFTLSQ